MYSGGSGLSIDIHFVDIELSYDVLSPLPTLLSKHFNHPHPYIEIATAISDSSVCPQCGLFTVEQKRKNAALSDKCKLLFFTMEIRRMPRVLFSSIIQLSKQNGLSKHQ